ncbi:MAG: hypothetical protein V4710_17595 [Verrucomicrobiota bacterium]
MLFEELITVLDPEPHPAPLNMAVDEMLLRSASVPCLRVYRWKRPSVSFGYFSRHAEVAREWPGRDLVRRWTGGGVVPHGEDVTYTLVLPLDCPLVGMGAPELYRLIHERIATVLGEGGTLAGSAAARVSDACFENPAMHDVLYGGRKVAGAAQRRTRSGLLHQGTVVRVVLWKTAQPGVDGNRKGDRG